MSAILSSITILGKKELQDVFTQRNCYRNGSKKSDDIQIKLLEREKRGSMAFECTEL